MSALVPFAPPGIDANGDMPLMRAGYAVASASFDDTARLLNWCNGRGAQLVPAFNPSTQMSADGLNGPVSVKYRLSVEPRYSAIQRVWVVAARSVDTVGSVYDATMGATYRMRAPHTTGSYGLSYHYAANRLDNLEYATFIETLTSQSQAEGEISVEIECLTGVMRVESVACWEVPRAELTTAQGVGSDSGLELNSFGSSAPIFDSATAGHNISEMAGACIQTLSNARRVGIFHQAWPDTTADAYTTTSATYVNMFYVDPPVLNRHWYRGDTQSAVRFRALVYGIGDIRITDSASSGTATISFSSAGAWSFATSTTLLVDCEDFAEASRLQGGAFDYLTIEARMTGGTRIYIASISVWDDIS